MTPQAETVAVAVGVACSLALAIVVIGAVLLATRREPAAHDGRRHLHPSVTTSPSSPHPPSL